MSTPNSAEQLGQAALDVGVLSERQLRSAWDEAGSSQASMEQLASALVRKGLLTNYQIERLRTGQREGYFFGDYTVLYLVGSGTFARVFRAAHKKTGEIHAIKVLRARHNNTQVADFFRREGELGKKLDHPNIVPIQDVVSRAGSHYLVMEFIEGQNLRELYKVRKRFAWRDAVSIVSDTLAGLHYAFGQGVTHRDLKMSNVLVASDGSAKLVDFGLAALDGVDKAAGVDRTVEYAALEKATGVRKDDTRSDVYFAGYMLHQMLSGVASLPEGRNRSRSFNRDTFTAIRPVIELAPQTPLAITTVVSKALELDPEKRFQNPGDMLTELKLAGRRAEGATSSGEQREQMSQEGLGPDGRPRRILVVESDVKRQDILRELFKRNGYRVLVAGDADRALQRFVNDPDAADVTLFCGATIGSAAVDAFNRFGEDLSTRDKPALLLLEEHQSAWVGESNTSDHRGVVVMPIKLRAIREAVLSALNAVSV